MLYYICRVFITSLVAVYLSALQFEVFGVHVNLSLVSTVWLLGCILSFIDIITAYPNIFY